jgi:hypothetical protein
MAENEAFAREEAAMRAVAAFQSGQAAQIALERTLGRGILAKMEGRQANLSSIYAELGGSDAGVAEMLQRVNPAFQKLPVGPGVAAAREAALSADLRSAMAAKGKSQAAIAALTPIESQAAHTLAALGGEEFAETLRASQ